MKEKIIETAGKIWRALGAKEEVEISSLAQLVREREDIVLQALGWLAREDKIVYRSYRGEDRVALVPKEYEAYRRLQGVKTTEKTSCQLKNSLRKLFDLKLL